MSDCKSETVVGRISAMRNHRLLLVTLNTSLLQRQHKTLRSVGSACAERCIRCIAGVTAFAAGLSKLTSLSVADNVDIAMFLATKSVVR